MILFYKQNLGKLGENAAAKFLKKKKYKILHRNYENYYGEIDIVAKDKEYLVFVEVKTRTGCDYGYASEAVDKRKQEKLYILAQTYMGNAYNSSVRFDIVEVYVDATTRKIKKINHIENAFGY